MNETRKRNHMIDAVKALAAMGVVLVHFQLPGVIGKIGASIGVFGVIIFFLISGYETYCDDASKSTKILKRFKRNLKITLIAILVYFVYTVIEQYLKGSLNTWAVTHLLDPVMYIRFFILGDFAFIHADHLWFLPALLYSYLILYWMEKNHLNKTFYKFLPFLVLLRIAMETYTNSFSHFAWLDWHFSGNALVGALPMMLLGNYLHHKKAFVDSLDFKKLIFGTFVSLILLFVFANIKVMNMDITQIFKISTATLVFLVCLKMPLDRPVKILSKIGRFYSLDIYLWHFLIGLMICELPLFAKIDQTLFEIGLPILTIICSILLSTMLNIKNRNA